MIKKAALIFLVLFILALAACVPWFRKSPTTTSSQPTTTTTQPTTTSSTTTPPTTTISTTPPTTITSANLTVHFIDVGQGDSILIDMGDTEVLIDAGVRSTTVADYIAPYVQGPLDVMIATHQHADHIGGLIEVLARYKVADIWTNGETATTVVYKDFTNAAKNEGAALHIAERGQTITAGSLTFKVLNPGRPLMNDANNDSIVLWLKYGDIDCLFEGDAEQEAEASMLAASVVPDCDILKVGHHGSRTASSAAYLNVAKPEVAIYMAVVGNTYGHPHIETINALHDIGATIYGTDVHGTITVTTDGTDYLVGTE
jgi:competence protein ComEC